MEVCEFVNFSIAKKLKEKGFKVSCIYAYCEKGCWNKEYETNKNKIQCSDPTISQVLEWLREKHLLVLPDAAYFDSEGVCISWDCNIWVGDTLEDCLINKTTYEQAALAGIEYCLNNLI